MRLVLPSMACHTSPYNRREFSLGNIVDFKCCYLCAAASHTDKTKRGASDGTKRVAHRDRLSNAHHIYFTIVHAYKCGKQGSHGNLINVQAEQKNKNCENKSRTLSEATEQNEAKTAKKTPKSRPPCAQDSRVLEEIHGNPAR